MANIECISPKLRAEQNCHQCNELKQRMSKRRPLRCNYSVKPKVRDLLWERGQCYARIKEIDEKLEAL